MNSANEERDTIQGFLIIFVQNIGVNDVWREGALVHPGLQGSCGDLVFLTARQKKTAVNHCRLHPAALRCAQPQNTYFVMFVMWTDLYAHNCWLGNTSTDSSNLFLLLDLIDQQPSVSHLVLSWTKQTELSGRGENTAVNQRCDL